MGFDATTLRVSLGIPFQVKLRYIHAGIGADSLVDLHNQILTLKETIISLDLEEISQDPDSQSGLVADEVQQNNDVEDLLTDSNFIGRLYSVTDPKTFGASKEKLDLQISSHDYQKLQEEYNKLIFQKHKV